MAGEPGGLSASGARGQVRMLRFSTTKVVSIIAAVLISFLLAVPSLMTAEQRQSWQASVPGWLPSWVVRTQATELRDDVRRILRETRVAPQGGIQVTPRGAQFRVPEPADREKVMPRLRELVQPISNSI